MMAGGGAYWWSRLQITPSFSEQSRYCGDRDTEPGRAVPGFIDHFVQGLVQLESRQQNAVLTGVAAGATRVTLQESGACMAGPGCCWTRGLFLLPGAGDVVERAQHPGHVPQGQIWLCALRQGPERFALEVDQDPSSPRRVEHLSEMVVAMDSLQRRPSGQ